MLQIGIDQNGGPTAAIGVIQARQHGGLLAEVARQLQQGDGSVGMGLLPLPDHSNRGIRRSVIDQHQPIHLGRANTRSMKRVITVSSLKQAATTQSCS